MLWRLHTLCSRYFACNMFIRTLLLTIALLAPASGVADAKTAVASINLCADQLVLLLADDDQIRSLSNLSHEEAGSYYYQDARRYPVNEGHAEQILGLQPDVVIVGEYSRQHTVAMLKEVGLTIHVLPIANNVEAVFQNILSVAEWVGHKERGVAIVALLRDKLGNIDPPVEPRPMAAVFDPNGYTSGRSSLRGQMMELAGFENAASVAGIDNYGKFSLESIIALSPDAIIESPYSPGTWSRAQAMSQHPALLDAGVDPHVIHIPSRKTVCGGPWTIDLIEQLQRERVKLSAGL